MLSADCGAHRVCVSPRADEELVRLWIWAPSSLPVSDRDAGDAGSDDTDGAERLVIWSGPREEILEEGPYIP